MHQERAAILAEEVGVVFVAYTRTNAIGGAVSYPRGRSRAPDELMRRVAVDVSGEVVSDCGLFTAEEAPGLFAGRLLAFFGEENG